MSDNTILPGTGETYASDDIGGVKHQRVKITHGVDGVSDGDASTSNPLPVIDPTMRRAAFGELETAERTPHVQLQFIYNLNTEVMILDTTGSGTTTQSNGMGVCSTGASASSSAQIASRSFIRYRPGQGVIAEFTGKFTAGVAGSTQFVGMGSDLDRVGFGFDGANFGLLHRNNGSDTWIPRTAWNIDKADGTGNLPIIDPTLGNVFAASYQYLGFGGILFEVEDPVTRRLTPVHLIQYANANTVPSLRNPSLPMIIEAVNTTNATNIVTSSASMAGFVQGRTIDLGLRYSTDNSKTGVGTTLTNVMTIQNKTSYQGTPNQVAINLIAASFSTDGTKSVTARLIKNATLGGAPSYTDLDTQNSVTSVDVAGTTVTGGRTITTIKMEKVGSQSRDLTPARLTLLPGETLTFAAAADASTSEVGASCLWSEEY